MSQKTIKVLLRTPYGFVFEIDSETCHFSESEFLVYVNEKPYGSFKTNVFSVFGLEPNKDYEIAVQMKHQTINCANRTEDVGYCINIMDYNATGDGIHDDSSAINTALYCAPEGATVIFPKGEYSVNNILLKSNVDLYLEEGAIIKQRYVRQELAILKGYQKDYNHDHAEVNASWEGNPIDTYTSLILAKNVKNCRIYGQGILDGSGAESDWWINAKVKVKAFRPKNIFLNHCENIVIAGITTQNSASWNIHPFYCDDISFYHVHCISDKTSPNTDGLNPESCKNVEICGCIFNVGDDCIAIKSGKYFMSQFDCRACSNIHISNCYMGDGHGGLAIGSEISGGVNHLMIEKCYMDQTDRGIRIKTRRGRGTSCVVGDIQIRNLEMQGVEHVLAMNMFYNSDPDGHSDYVKNKEVQEKDDFTPTIGNIEVNQLQATRIRGCAVFMYGLPENHITNIKVKDSLFSFAKDRNISMPEMLDDFDLIPDLGIFIKNADQLRVEETDFIGNYTKVVEEEITVEKDK